MLQTAIARWNGVRSPGMPNLRLSLVPTAASAAEDKPAPVSSVNHQPVLQSDFSELVRAVATRRDREAFARLFDHYAPRLKSFLIRQGADDTQAEDIAQETMLAVWRKAEMFDPAKASAGTWIFTIARNLRIDAIRKARRPEFDPNDPAFVPDPERPADEVMDADRMGRKIREALSELPEEQATVVRLSFFEDKPHAEIAEQLSLPLGTVKSRLRLAMRRIKSILGENE